LGQLILIIKFQKRKRGEKIGERMCPFAWLMEEGRERDLGRRVGEVGRKGEYTREGSNRGNANISVCRIERVR